MKDGRNPPAAGLTPQRDPASSRLKCGRRASNQEEYEVSISSSSCDVHLDSTRGREIMGAGPVPRAVVPVPTPTVISGNDIGFRVEGLRGRTTPVGRLVIRVDGQWVEPEISESAQTRRLTAR
jgi:hypothetical protein